MTETLRHPPHVYKVVIDRTNNSSFSVIRWIRDYKIEGRISWHGNQFTTTVYLDNDGDLHKLCNDYQDHILTIGPDDRREE
jgi:hypothetical protein